MLSLTLAQVIPDATLGREASVVRNRFGTQQIGGGARRGESLFHSFSVFNLKVGDRAYFESPSGINTIFSRVTGRGASTIDGTLGIAGRANLFFMNPNGILFGPNARLDIQGNMTFTTADRVLFNDNQTFAANPRESTPLLTVNIPIGLQWSARNAGVIQSQTADLQTASGKSLQLFGNGIELTGGSLRSPQGQIQIASVTNNETLALQPNGFNLGNTQLAPIKVSQGAVIDVSGESAGAITIAGSQIRLMEGAGVSADVFGDGSASIPGGIQVTGSDRIEILGDPDLKRSSTIMSDTLATATGDSANITVATPNLILRDGARIQTRTFGSGKGGDITVRAQNIDASGGLIDVPDGPGRTIDIATGIASRVEAGATGSGGTVTIESEKMNLNPGAEFRASTRGNGNAGNLIISARTITAIGGKSPFLTGFNTASDSSANLNATGNGGDLLLTADQLYLLEGASIRAGTSGKGDAGNITLRVKDLIVSGFDPTDGNQSVISTATATLVFRDGTRIPSSGKGGDLTIISDRIQVLNGGIIRSSTNGTGDAGSLTLQAKTIEVVGWQNWVSPTGTGSGIRRSGISNASFNVGHSGVMRLMAERLSVRDGAQVSAAARSSGNGGTMVINASLIELIGAAPDEQFPTGLFVSVEPRASGNGGSLWLNADRLIITDGSAISADTFGSGRASDVLIVVQDSIVIRGMGPQGLIPSRIGSSSRQSGDRAAIPTGNGGNLSIKTRSLSIEDGGILTAATVGVGNAGSIAVTAERIALKSGGQILVGSEGKGTAGNLTLETQTLDLVQRASIRAESREGKGGNIDINSRDHIFLNDHSRITTNAIENADGGNIKLQSQLIFQGKQSDITANAIKGRGGNITIDAEGILTSQDSRISASSQLGIRGSVRQTNPALDDRSTTPIAEPEPIAPEQVLANSCLVQQTEKQGKFVVTGNGGLPENPTDLIVAPIETVTVTAIDPSHASFAQAPSTEIPAIAPPERLPNDTFQEATDLVRNPDGSISLATGAPALQPREQVVCQR